jgi:hypothetical protein
VLDRRLDRATRHAADRHDVLGNQVGGGARLLGKLVEHSV